MEDNNDEKLVTLEQLGEFADKIAEALRKFQATNPALSEQDITAIRNLVFEYLNTYILEFGNGLHISVVDLLNFAIHSIKKFDKLPLEGIFVKNSPQWREYETAKYGEKAGEIVATSPFLSTFNSETAQEILPLLDMFIDRKFMGVCNHDGVIFYVTDTKDYQIEDDYDLISEKEFYGQQMS